MTPVLIAPLFDPGTGRVDMEMPAGLTVAQMVARGLPDMVEADRLQARVTLVTPGGAWAIEPINWHSVRPKPGVRVVIRIVPGKAALRSVLMIAVAVAAVALGGPLGGMLASTFSGSKALWTAAATLGINVLGSLLVNALVPPPEPREERPSYSIAGWRNRFAPDGAVPVVMGKMRYAPVFAASPYTEIVGDWQYVRALFTFGYGPLRLTDLRLGETPLSEYDEVDVEIRNGWASDDIVTLYSRQVFEETLGIDLTRPKPRDDMGEVTSDDGVETPVVRTTGDDASGASIILAFPAGLVKMNDEGEPRSYSIRIRIERRLAGTTPWTLIEMLDIRARQTDAFFRQHSWTFPTRGRWEIRLTRMNTESTKSTVSDRVVWAALQTIRPEYPINFDEQLCLVALRIKATHQINGSLDNFSAIAERFALDYDHTTGEWTTRPTSNPAALYRYALMSPANPRRVAASAIDLAVIEDWHDYCRTNGLTYNRVIEEAGTTLIDVLREISLAGRATPRHDGLKWGVTIDCPQDLVVDHISPRNAAQIRTSRSYVRQPDGIRVTFMDETNDYAPAEWLIPWLGHAGPVDLTELLEMPGKTNPDEICMEVYRRMLEAKYRPDSYEAMQDGRALVVTRGDLVALSSDVIDEAQQAAVVAHIAGETLYVDEQFEVGAGTAYGIRFRVFDGGGDTIGRSIVRTVDVTVDASGTELRLTGAGEVPKAGDLILFGRAGTETRRVIVTGIETAEGAASLIRMIDAAPEIDAELATLDPLPWTGRVGWVPDMSDLMPPAPVWASVQTGMAGYSDFMDEFLGNEAARTSIVYQLRPGPGSVPTLSYRIEHRLQGASSWSAVQIPAGNGGGNIAGYALGDTVQIRAAAISGSGAQGAYGPTVTAVIGAGDAAIPDGETVDGIEVTVAPGGVRIDCALAADSPATQLQLYRSTSATLNRATDKSGRRVAVTAGQPVTLYAGDLSRRNLIGNGAFDSASGWTMDAGWSITAGRAEHASGSAGRISAGISLASGATYRITWTAAGFGIGATNQIRAELTGSPANAGAWRGAPGRYSDRLTAPGGAPALAIYADSGFGGSIDNIIIYRETAGCLPVGLNYFWIEPINADGVAGDVIGPFTASIE